MKAFICNPTFSAEYDEDPYIVLRNFDTSYMCTVKQEEKRQAVPIMLKGNALELLCRKGKPSTTYQQVTDLPKNC